MPSKEYLQEMKEILNSNGKYSEEEVIYISEKTLELYKTIEKILNNNVNGNEEQFKTTKIKGKRI